MQASAKWFEFDTHDDPQLEAMLRAATRFAQAVSRGYGTPWLVLMGSSGVGKTHLARRIWRWWWNTGRFYKGPRDASLVHRGQFCKWTDFVEECRGKDSSRMIDLCADRFLILDDIGAGADARGWMADKLYRILEKRLEGSTKATLITANMNLEQLSEAFDPRIASRLLRCGRDKVVEVNTTDHNMR